MQSQDTVKIFVALWDSPPHKDLYWGMKYGIKTYFSKEPGWELVKESKGNQIIQEKVIYYNKDLDIFMEAMAYHTDSIKTTITDFIHYAYAADSNELVVYVGHDGLMDFDIDVDTESGINRCDAMVFSCVSETYFSHYLNMILSTYTLMAPEAYGVMAAIESWAKGEREETIRKNTAIAYAKYQKIPVWNAEQTFME